MLGVLSLVACGLLGPFAWAMGSTDLKKMQAGDMDRRGESETRAGMICGMVATILLGIGLVFVVVWFLCIGLVVGAGVMGGAGNAGG